MAATAGRLFRVKVSGDPLAFTNEAASTTDNTVYQIADATKRVWDRAGTLTVKNSGVAVDPVADPYTVNRLSGKITFASATARVITVSGNYLPLSVLAEAHDADFSATSTNGDESTFGDSLVVRSQLSTDCAGSVSRFSSVDAYIATAFDAEAPVVFELAVNGTPRLRAWALLNKNALQGDRKSYVEESVTFEGTADADGRSFTFSL